jgi:hypothetical protein
VDTPENLAKGMGTASRLSITIAGAQGAIVSAISDVYGVKQVERISEKERGVINYLVESDKEVDVRKPIFFAMAKLGCPIIEMRSMDMSLEEIFLELVTSEREMGAAGGGEGSGGESGGDGGAQGGPGAGSSSGSSSSSGSGSGESDGGQSSIGAQGGPGPDGAGAPDAGEDDSGEGAQG